MQTIENYNTTDNVIPFFQQTAAEPVVEMVNGKPMTTSLQVAAFFKKEHHNVLRDIKNILDTVGNSTALNFEASRYVDSTGRKLPMYFMDKDAFTLLVMGYTGEDAMRFKLAYIQRFNEMEEVLRSTAVPQSLPEALRLAADLAEKAERAALERDEAIRTKAWIGSNREATAMNKASQAMKKVYALEDELGIGRNYKQVKAIDWLKEEFVLSAGMYSQVGRKLSELSSRMGYDTRLIESEQFPKGIKAYHIDVIDAFRAMLRTDRNMLAKYRRR